MCDCIDSYVHRLGGSDLVAAWPRRKVWAVYTAPDRGRWVKPTLVVEVGFVEWTAEGLLRHSAFVGIREDKKPRDVTRELAVEEDG